MQMHLISQQCHYFILQLQLYNLHFKKYNLIQKIIKLDL